MAPITIDDVSKRIVQIAGTVAGIKRTYDPAPPNMLSDDLVCSWVFTDPAQYLDFEDDENVIQTVRIFRIQTACLTIAQGDPYNRETIVRPLIDTMVRKFQGYSTLNNLSFVRSHRVVSDSGVVILPEYGGQFIGFEVRLSVEYLYDRVFEPGE